MVLALLLSLFDKEYFLAIVTTTNDWILNHFDWLYSYTSFAMVVLCIAVFFSPISKLKIGGKNATPLLGKWRWFSIVLCTTIAVGILFWGTSEPLYHISDPPGSIEGTASFALASVYMHWSITPYAIYTIPALLFALGFYNYNTKYSLGAMLFPIWRNRTGWYITAIDALCLFSLVAGMSTVLGVGMLSISGGISGESQLDRPVLLFFIGAAMVLAFTISAATGLLKGIRILSSINITIFIIIGVSAFFLGPTSFIISNTFLGLKTFFTNFLPQSFAVGSFGDKSWMHSWTTFYWANWMAWAPITALFLGRISYGYTVRQFIFFNWLIPAGFGILWMSIFSGTSLYLELDQHAGLLTTLNEAGPDAIIYRVFDYLPFAKVFAALFLFTVFLSFVTAADSNTEAMAAISSKGISPESSNPPTFIKYIWGIVIGLVGWVMVSFAGVDGVKMLSNIGGLPALLLMVVLCISMVKLLVNATKQKKK